MKITLADIVRTAIIYLILSVAVILMAKTIIQYAGFDETAGFLKVKQEYLPIITWKVAFYTHVFSSIFCLAAGFTQFSEYLRKNYEDLHKKVGKLYVYNILFINFPAALVMAYYANGFLPSKIAFFILDALWFWFTLKALIEIKRKNIRGHENYMIRSYALTFSAITLRTWKLILSNTISIDPVTLYIVDAWLGFVPNLLIAELIIWTKIKKKSTPKVHIH